MAQSMAPKTSKESCLERSPQSSSVHPGFSGWSGAEAEVLGLQQHVGNQAVSQLLQASQAIAPDAGGIPAIVRSVINSDRGRPLEPEVQAEMESRFQQDFSQVRIHTDSEAAESAQAVNANAYTIKQDIAFDAGRYAPESKTGKQLLAHELAHVVQQSRGGAPPSHSPHSFLEKSADQAASAVNRGGEMVQVSGASAPGLARQEKKEETLSFRERLRRRLAGAYHVITNVAPSSAPILEPLKEPVKQALQAVSEDNLKKAEQVAEPVLRFVEAVAPVLPPKSAASASSPNASAQIPKKPEPTGEKTVQQIVGSQPLVVDTTNWSPDAQQQVADALEAQRETDLAFEHGEVLPGFLDDHYNNPNYIDQFQGKPDFNPFTGTVTLDFEGGKRIALQAEHLKQILKSMEADPQKGTVSLEYFKSVVLSNLIDLKKPHAITNIITPNSITQKNAPRLIDWFKENRESMELQSLMMQAGKGTLEVVGKRAENRLLLEIGGVRPDIIARQKILETQAEGNPDAEKALTLYFLLQTPLHFLEGSNKVLRGENELSLNNTTTNRAPKLGNVPEQYKGKTPDNDVTLRAANDNAIPPSEPVSNFVDLQTVREARQTQVAGQTLKKASSGEVFAQRDQVVASGQSRGGRTGNLYSQPEPTLRNSTWAPPPETGNPKADRFESKVRRGGKNSLYVKTDRVTQTGKPQEVEFDDYRASESALVDAKARVGGKNSIYDVRGGKESEWRREIVRTKVFKQEEARQISGAKKVIWVIQDKDVARGLRDFFKKEGFTTFDVETP